MALTAAEAAELAALEKQYGSPQASSGLTPAEAAELAQLEASQKPQEMGTGMKVLTGAGKALDYAGGISRAALANAIDTVTPGKSFASGKDMLQALQANPFDSKAKGAPSTAEYLERAGVPAGASLSDDFPFLFSKTGDGLPLQKGGWADPTIRGAAGFVGDVAIDPLTYLTLGASAAAKSAKAADIAAKKGIAQAAPSMASKILTSKAGKAVARPLDAMGEYFGKKIYKSGLKGVDNEALKYGKEPVSDLLMEEGIAGSAKSIQGQMDTLGERLLQERQAVLREASKAGGTVSMKEAMGPTVARIQEIRSSKDPARQALADALEAEVAKYTKLDAVPEQELLRTLPRQGEMVGGHTPIEVVPGKEVLSELPTKATYKNVTEGGTSAGLRQGGEFVPSKPVLTYEKVAPEIKPGVTVPDEFVPREPLMVYDTVPAIPGVDPLTATKYKSAVTGSLPQSAFQSDAVRGAAKQAEKEMGRGLKTAVETGVDRATGRGAELRDLNDKLGRILTTKKKQAMEASKEVNKNAFSSVDGALLGNAISDATGNGATMALLKKIADITKMTGPRTTVGKAMTQGTGKADVLARRLYWEQMMKDEANKEAP